MPFAHRTAPASTTRKPAPARRSFSSTSSAATTAAGTTRCAISVAAGAASPGARAAIRRRRRPEDEALYGQDHFNRDAIAVLDAARVARAHIVGLSMGGYTALMLAAKYPDRVLSCTAAGAGSGSPRETRQQFIQECRHTAAEFERTAKINAEGMGLGPTRVQLQIKDPIGWRRSVAHLAEHPAHAAAKTLRTVQAGRASLYDLEGN